MTLINLKWSNINAPNCQQQTHMHCSPYILLVAELFQLFHRLTTHHHYIMHTTHPILRSSLIHFQKDMFQFILVKFLPTNSRCFCKCYPSVYGNVLVLESGSHGIGMQILSRIVCGSHPERYCNQIDGSESSWRICHRK